MSLPDPVLEPHSGILVLRDDLLPGGTKRRVLDTMLTAGGECVYASPAQGYAQVALAYSAAAVGARATIFVAQRAALHPHTAEAHAAGAQIVQVPYGYLSNVTARARAYAAAVGATLLPFGLDTPAFIAALAAVARALPIRPAEVWSAAGSGVLTRALQLAWPDAAFHAVQVGKPPAVGQARLWQAPERFEQDAAIHPPFPSCSNYDAKVWRFAAAHAAPGALFWNVA